MKIPGVDLRHQAQCTNKVLSGQKDPERQRRSVTLAADTIGSVFEGRLRFNLPSSPSILGGDLEGKLGWVVRRLAISRRGIISALDLAEPSHPARRPLYSEWVYYIAPSEPNPDDLRYAATVAGRIDNDSAVQYHVLTEPALETHDIHAATGVTPSNRFEVARGRLLSTMGLAQALGSMLAAYEVTGYVLGGVAGFTAEFEGLMPRLP